MSPGKTIQSFNFRCISFLGKISFNFPHFAGFPRPFLSPDNSQQMWQNCIKTFEYIHTYLLKYSGKDSVDICREPTECWEGTESNLDDPNEDDEINGAFLGLELVIKLPGNSENFSASPLICKVSAV